MFEIIIVFLVLFFLSFGVLGLIFFLNRKMAKQPWNFHVNENYLPKVSIIVPTHNESATIRLKLENLRKLDYPEDLTQLILVDSNSSDNTLDIVEAFINQYNCRNLLVLPEKERKGKSAALNFALKHCTGDVIVVSDADCFWPSNILRVSLPFLSPTEVGAISGPKVLLNDQQSWTTKVEAEYLSNANLLKLGESKIWSTILFEGGFSAYKKEVLDSFDPFNTGADDCGTLLSIAMKNHRAILVPDAIFYTTFPLRWKDKLSMKLRRGHQIIRVLKTYLQLTLQSKIPGPKRVILQSLFNFIVAPWIFFGLLVATVFLLYNYPFFLLALLLLAIPRVRFNVLEVIQSYGVLLISMIGVALGKQFLVWSQPNDRDLLTEEVLRQRNLI